MEHPYTKNQDLLLSRNSNVTGHSTFYLATLTRQVLKIQHSNVSPKLEATEVDAPSCCFETKLLLTWATLCNVLQGDS